jgi:hypothetical protein
MIEVKSILSKSNHGKKDSLDVVKQQKVKQFKMLQWHTQF